MNVSDDESRIGVILGRIVVQDELEITNVVIYVREGKQYVVQKTRKFPFKDACIRFSFSKRPD